MTDYDGKTILIEEGTKIILPLNALHSHPDFYADAEKFDPDRFDESTGGVKRLKDAGVFMPFGNGPRTCLGKINKIVALAVHSCVFKIRIYFL